MKNRHRFHGDPRRFELLAELINDRYRDRITYIADVAGGQGMLARILNKKYNYQCEVVDPRGWVLRGVPSRQEAFQASLASYYDLIVGLHPDEATRAVAEAALVRPTILIPCCNFSEFAQRISSFLCKRTEDLPYDHNLQIKLL